MKVVTIEYPYVYYESESGVVTIQDPYVYYESENGWLKRSEIKFFMERIIAKKKEIGYISIIERTVFNSLKNKYPEYLL